MLLHHVGLVVESLKESIPLFKSWLHAKQLGEIVEDRIQGARIQLFMVNESALLLELIEVLPDVPHGMHETGQFHLCYIVADIDQEMARLHNHGAVVIHQIEKVALFNDRRMAFLATDSGQLLELLEDSNMIVQ